MTWQVLETDPETTSTLSPEPDFPPSFDWHSSEVVKGIQRTPHTHTVSRLGFCFFAGKKMQAQRAKCGQGCMGENGEYTAVTLPAAMLDIPWESL